METGKAPQPTRPENQKPKVGDFGIENTTKAEKVRYIGESLWQRVTAAKDSLVARYEQIKERSKAKVGDLSRKAAVWGLTHVGVPIEDLLRQIFYELPADVKDWQARRKDRKVYKLREKQRSVMDDAEVLIELIQKIIVQDLLMLSEREKRAKREADRLRYEAERSREKGKKKFNVRRIVEELQTR